MAMLSHLLSCTCWSTPLRVRLQETTNQVASSYLFCHTRMRASFPRSKPTPTLPEALVTLLSIAGIKPGLALYHGLPRPLTDLAVVVCCLPDVDRRKFYICPLTDPVAVVRRLSGADRRFWTVVSSRKVSQGLQALAKKPVSRVGSTSPRR